MFQPTPLVTERRSIPSDVASVYVQDVSTHAPRYREAKPDTTITKQVDQLVSTHAPRYREAKLFRKGYRRVVIGEFQPTPLVTERRSISLVTT